MTINKERVTLFPAMCGCASCRDGLDRNINVTWAIAANDTHNASFGRIADGFEAMYLTREEEVAA